MVHEVKQSQAMCLNKTRHKHAAKELIVLTVNAVNGAHGNLFSAYSLLVKITLAPKMVSLIAEDRLK